MKRAGFAFVIATVAGCASTPSSVDRPGADEQPDGVDVRPYAPFGVGASWTYEAEDLGDPNVHRVQVRIIDFAKGFYRDSQGTEYRHTVNGLRDRHRYLIRNPVWVGRKWKVTRDSSAVERFEVLSVGEPCDVPAGRFDDCLVIKAYRRRNNREAQHVRYTWVKDVGLAQVLVEGEIKGRGRFKQSVRSLLEYRPSADAPPPPASSSAPATDEEGAPTEWTR